MHDFDAILGMDWLSTHHAVVECFEKRVIFHIPGQFEFFFEGDRIRNYTSQKIRTVFLLDKNVYQIKKSNN